MLAVFANWVQKLFLVHDLLLLAREISPDKIGVKATDTVDPLYPLTRLSLALHRESAS